MAEQVETGAEKTPSKSKPLLRQAGVTVPAALVTLGVFVGMNALISVDEVQLDEVKPVTLVDITPQIEVIEVRSNDRQQADRIEVSSPPPQPKLPAPQTDIDIGAPDYVVEPPTVERPTIVALPAPSGLGIDRTLQAVRAPVAVYPQRLLADGVTGSCEVRMSVDDRGKPFNVEADCTDPGFKREAERAVRQAEFVPSVVDGRPVTTDRVVYPIVFELD